MRKFPWRRNKVRMFADGPRRLTLIEAATFSCFRRIGNEALATSSDAGGDS